MKLYLEAVHKVYKTTEAGAELPYQQCQEWVRGVLKNECL